MSIITLFDQAQLAEAAYANLTGAIGNQNVLKDALDVANKDQFGGSFSAAQAAEFVLHWRVINQSPQLGLLGSGFSATVFESKRRVCKMIYLAHHVSIQSLIGGQINSYCPPYKLLTYN